MSQHSKPVSRSTTHKIITQKNIPTTLAPLRGISSTQLQITNQIENPNVHFNMQLLKIFIATLFTTGVWSLPAPASNDDPSNNSYGPSDENPYPDNVWPRSVTQQVQDFLNHHFTHIDESSGTDENKNNDSMSTQDSFRPAPLSPDLRSRQASLEHQKVTVY